MNDLNWQGALLMIVLIGAIAGYVYNWTKASNDR